jgi:hypothetical protein
VGTSRIEGGTVYASGRQTATGRTGGHVDVLGTTVRLAGATVDASGRTAGGTIRVGGDYQGKNPAVPNAETTSVGPGTVLRADAAAGTGGRVIVWADGQTDYAGRISAGGRAAGGFVEVSGKGELTYGGTADAGKGGPQQTTCGRPWCSASACFRRSVTNP